MVHTTAFTFFAENFGFGSYLPAPPSLGTLGWNDVWPNYPGGQIPKHLPRRVGRPTWRHGGRYHSVALFSRLLLSHGGVTVIPSLHSCTRFLSADLVVNILEGLNAATWALFFLPCIYVLYICIFICIYICINIYVFYDHWHLLHMIQLVMCISIKLKVDVLEVLTPLLNSVKTFSQY